MTAPLVLGFDTAGSYCAAALVRGETVMDAVAEEMARGQAERLMPLLEELLARHDVTWSQLDALAVGTGPGNFTGIRIGVAAARALALGLGCPAYGVTGFEARAALAPEGTHVAIPAPRDMAYLMTGTEVSLRPAAEVVAMALEPRAADLARAIAVHGAKAWPAQRPAPAPFYVRAPDAAPARDAPPPLVP